MRTPPYRISLASISLERLSVHVLFNKYFSGRRRRATNHKHDKWIEVPEASVTWSNPTSCRVLLQGVNCQRPGLQSLNLEQHIGLFSFLRDTVYVYVCVCFSLSNSRLHLCYLFCIFCRFYPVLFWTDLNYSTVRGCVQCVLMTNRDRLALSNLVIPSFQENLYMSVADTKEGYVDRERRRCPDAEQQLDNKHLGSAKLSEEEEMQRWKELTSL